MDDLSRGISRALLPRRQGWRSQGCEGSLQQSACWSSRLQGHSPALQRCAELHGEFRETQPLHPHRCEVQVPIRLCSRGSEDCVRPVATVSLNRYRV